ncbi:peptide ABC transporter substrate-binding protein [Oleiharenicola lentus]|uniref:peptide ABC transporter substrate-binding protein n=1 Tax=Oleiharenicola lentus TaxID=2508720 RepID=UPI003F6786C5
MRLKLFAACFLISLSLFEAGCRKRETPVSQGNREGIFYFSVGSEPSDLDPHVVNGIGEAKIIHALFEPLLNFDPKTLKPVPALAERWDVSPDGLTYTFHLRAGAKWSNDETITAQDCVDAWRRVLTPTLGADNAYMFYVIRGAEAFNKGQTTDFASVGISAADARTFVVTLTNPAPYFPQILLNSPFRPVNVRAIEKIGNAYVRGTPWTKPHSIVTSGPFHLKKWSLHERIETVKSATYWDRDNVKLNGIMFYPTDSVDSEEKAFRAGQLHATWSLSLSKVDGYRRDQSAALRIDAYLNTYFFRFNTRTAPLNDPRVRRALSLAIDRASITQKILKGGQRPAPSFVPPEMPDYTAPELPPRDLDTAKRLLAEAGYADGKGLPIFEVTLDNSEILRLVAESVQEMWRRDLGVNVSLVNLEKKVVFANRRAGNYQILFGDWIGDYLDATTFLDLWRSDSGNNYTGWGSPEYDALMNRAATTGDIVARAKILQQAELLMIAGAPIASVYFNSHVYLLQPSVKGWMPSPGDHVDYRHVSLEP